MASWASSYLRTALYFHHWRSAPNCYFQIHGVSCSVNILLTHKLKISRLSLKHVAEAGTIAEEVISTVRTAHAFGTQTVLSGLYDVHVGKAHKVDLKSAVWFGSGMAAIFFIIYTSYSLGSRVYLPPIFFANLVDSF
jgi:ATP-binding cassette subfamily B (MDR/TAP) protein 1